MFVINLYPWYHNGASKNCTTALFRSLYVSPNNSVARFLTLFLQVDAVICAELLPAAADIDIPEEKKQRKKLEDLATSNMTHGRAQSRAGLHGGGQVLQEVPQALCQAHHDEPGQRLPHLQEEDGGRTITINRNGVIFHVTNADIVPYSPFLRMKFEADINVG